MPFEKDPNDIGALWEKASAKGRYMTGTVNGVAVVVFVNKHKSSEKHPDWRVLKLVPKGERPAHNANVPPPPGDEDLGF